MVALLLMFLQLQRGKTWQKAQELTFENHTKGYKRHSQGWSTERIMAETIAELKTTIKQLFRGQEEGTAKCAPP